MTPEQQYIEYTKCAASPAYFIHEYCQVENKSRNAAGDVAGWIPFRLWPAQERVLRILLSSLLVLVLKARQLGLSWLVTGYALWLLLFRPGSQVLMFSRRDDEAIELLARLRGMHERLPPFLRATIGADNDHELEFATLGSVAKSFPTTKDSGRSYTATLVVIDEADFIQWLKQLLTAVKPTVDAGGQLVLITTSNKERPQSEFKRLWRAASDRLNGYAAVFLPWSARPGRDAAWYAQQARDYEQDDLWQEYPATPTQALATRSARMRFRPTWLDRCRAPMPALVLEDAPAIPNLLLYEKAEKLNEYLVIVDTSEGDTTSDPSPVTVLNKTTWSEAAHLHGRFEPAVVAGYAVSLASYYHGATICIERNNHGHAAILAAGELIATLEFKEDQQQAETWIERRPSLYVSPFDGKTGWLSDSKHKTLAVDHAAQVFKEGGIHLRTEATLLELAGIEAATLRAVEGETDDRAMTIIIGLAVLKWPTAGGSGRGFAARY